MSFLTKVITDTSPDFGDNPQIVTENGQPASVDVENLISNTGYWTKAEIWQNGVLNDTSEVESFQTLPAGTITLTHQSSVRSGSNYVVTYTYTSTYALSSSVLRCGASVSSQGVISGNTITFTVSGLVPGDAYLSQITTIDIYGESAQTTITLVMPVVNQVSITSTTATASTVECELDYTIDGGFTQGWVEYWDEGDDPSTDQAQGHNTFIDGETSCTIAGLTDGTTYQFRATIYYGGYVNYVTSNVVTATTVTDYDSKYFTIKNTGTGTTTVTLLSKSSSPLNPNPVVYVSTDNGSTWHSHSPTTAGNTLGTLSSGRKMLLKNSNGAMSPDNNVRLVITNSTNGPIELSGNIASLCFGDNFTGTKTMPDYAYASLFRLTDSTVTAIDAQNLSFASYNSIGGHGMEKMFAQYEGTITPPNLSSITSVGDYGMASMFGDCTGLTTPPDLSNVTSIGICAMQSMFDGCNRLATPPDLSGIRTVSNSGMNKMFHVQINSTLTTPPDLSNVTSVGVGGMSYMFYNCKRLSTPPDLSNVRTVDKNGMQYMLYDCNALTTPPDLSSVTSVGDGGMNSMFYSCDALTTAPDLSSVTSVGEGGMQSMFYNCSALTTPPDLSNVTSVGTSGMVTMFYGCRLLKTAYAPTITWDTDKTKNWLQNVAASGKLYANGTKINSIPTNNTSGCPSGWTKERI